MKVIKKIILAVILLLISLTIDYGLLTAFSLAGIANTKHNLSAGGPHVADQTIYAQTEEEICVFCHIPHNANPVVPLWNHTVSSAAYTMYNSEYLNRASYDVPTDLGTYPNVGYRSRLCLSCHDGTVAIGSVYASLISMTGVTAGGYMPTTATGYIDTYLKDDHPVAIKYDTGITINFGSGTKTMELTTPAPSVNPTPYQGVKLYPPQSGTIQGYVECTSCHDPHVETDKFLVIWNTNLATTISDICATCHTKDNWTGSIHQSSTTAIDNPGSETQPIPGSTVAEAACMACHKTHGGLGVPYLNRKVEENTCFYGTSTSCHGTAGAKNIETVITRSYKHPTTAISGEHTNLDVLSSSYLDWASNRHGECLDCHNPHQAQQGAHTPANQWYPTTVGTTTNEVSNILKGVTGVEPDTEPLWGVATSYTTRSESLYEYQICFKCHSYYGLQDPDGITSYTTASGATVTDQAMEFSRGNKSAHPVKAGLSSQTGSYSPKALTSAQMSSPWNTNVGSQTMYCSDCHGADNEASGDPKGPHGSNSKFMLKGTYKYWPLRNDGQPWNISDKNNFSSYGGLFCKNCHPIYDGSWKNNVHSKTSGMGAHENLDCVKCHVAVPHGSKRSRLIGYSSDPSPYNYNGNSLKITAFQKVANPQNYDDSNCNVTCSTPGKAPHNLSGGDP